MNVHSVNDVNCACRLMRALANETRLNMLLSLQEHRKTWTELLFELEINPKSLRDHLACLRKRGFIHKSKPVGFELTKPARTFIETSLSRLLSVTQLAMNDMKLEATC